MSHVIARKGVLEGSSLALFLALVHTVNDGVTAILGALLPTLQERLDVGPTLLAMIVATFWIASSLLQPFFGALAEQVGPRTIGALGVISAALFLSLVGVAHNRALGVGLFTAGGMVGFALGPLLILALISKYGIEATPWLMIPGLLLGALVYIVLPRYEPHPRKPVRRLVGTNLIRGPIGMLAVAGGFTSVAFVTFTSSVPLWLVQEQGYEADAALIGWTLAVFAFAAGVGALIGGVIESRIGRQNLIVGSLLLTAVPLFAFLRLEPGSGGFFAAAAVAGMLILISGPVIVALAQELAPESPAAAGGTVLGMASAIGGVLYIALGHLQAAIGLESGIAIGFSMVVPAALVTLVVLRRTQPVRA